MIEPLFPMVMVPSKSSASCVALMMIFENAEPSIFEVAAERVPLPFAPSRSMSPVPSWLMVRGVRCAWVLMIPSFMSDLTPLPLRLMLPLPLIAAVSLMFARISTSSVPPWYSSNEALSLMFSVLVSKVPPCLTRALEGYAKLVLLITSWFSPVMVVVPDTMRLLLCVSSIMPSKMVRFATVSFAYRFTQSFCAKRLPPMFALSIDVGT